MSTADEQAQAWWAALDYQAARLDLVAHMSDVEVRMLAHARWTP
ncbi:MAG: hypothetical protein ABWZ77_05145 [Naasia sp.]